MTTRVLAKKEIGNRWKALSSEEKQLFKDMARKESNELTKDKALSTAKPGKNYMQVRISLRAIFSIITRLNSKQREAVTFIGLGGLLDLKCTHLDHGLCTLLVEKFDPKLCALNVHGEEHILTTRDVHRLLGISAGGHSMETKGQIEGLTQLCSTLGVENGAIQLSRLRIYLMTTNDDNVEFKRKFVLFIIGSFLCPTTMPAVGHSFVHIVRDVESMKNYDWAKLTLDFLVEGIRICKSKGHKRATGCVFLLVLFYLDRLAPIVCSHDVPDRFSPSMAYWGDVQIRQTLKLFKMIGGYQKLEDDVKLNIEEEDSGTDFESEGLASHDDTILRTIATNTREIKNLLVQLVNLHSRREYNSRAEWLMREPGSIPSEFQKENLEHKDFNLEKAGAETVASSPTIKKVDVVVLTSNTEHRTRSSPKQSLENQPGKVDHHDVVVVSDTAASSPAIKFDCEALPSNTEYRTVCSPKQSLGKNSGKVDHHDVVVVSDDTQSTQLLKKSPLNARRGRPRKKNQCEVMSKFSPVQSAYDLLSWTNDGGRRTRLSEERVPGPNMRSPYVPWSHIPKKNEDKKKLGTKRKLVVDEDDELGSDDAQANQLLGNLDLLCKALGGNNNSEAPPFPIYVHPQPLSEVDHLLVAYWFRSDSSDRETVVRMELHGVEVEVATRNTICSLRPNTWIDAEIINMVSIKLTNAQRVAHPDECHTTWYFPTYISQKILDSPPYAGKIQELSRHYCTPDMYTGQIHACREVYVPMNDGGTHWFCLKLDMVLQQIYLFDSKPSSKANTRRKTLAATLVRELQELFYVSYGHFHVANLMDFEWLNVECPTLQAPNDSHDCGLFVIKFMQGVPLPHGIFTFDDLERQRLVVDIVRDPSNSTWKEFSASFDDYTERLVRSVTMDRD